MFVYAASNASPGWSERDVLDVSKRVLLRIPTFSSISDSGASGGAGALSLLAAPRGEIAPAGHASLSLSLSLPPTPSPLLAFTVAQSGVTTHKAPPPHPTPPLYQVLNAAAEVVNEIIAGRGGGGVSLGGVEAGGSSSAGTVVGWDACVFSGWRALTRTLTPPVSPPLTHPAAPPLILLTPPQGESVPPPSLEPGRFWDFYISVTGSGESKLSRRDVKKEKNRTERRLLSLLFLRIDFSGRLFVGGIVDAATDCAIDRKSVV